MITITDEQLDEMAGVLYHSTNNVCAPRGALAYEIHRAAVEVWFSKYISGMVSDIWFWAYGPASIGRYDRELRRMAE